MSSPADLSFLAMFILSKVTVFSSPKLPEGQKSLPLNPGETLDVYVTAGYLPPGKTDGGPLPGSPPAAAGPAGVITGKLKEVIEGTPGSGGGQNKVDELVKALEEKVQITVEYKWFESGQQRKTFKMTPLSEIPPEPLGPNGNQRLDGQGKPVAHDPLQAKFLFAPPLVEDKGTITPIDCELQVTVTVFIGYIDESATWSIPVALVPIPLPALLIMTGGDEEGENKVLVVKRSGNTSIKGVLQAATVLNTLVSALKSVKEALDWGMAVDALVGNLNYAVDMIGNATQMAGFAVDKVPVFDDMNDFDDEAKVSFLIGPVGTKVGFYSSDDYNDFDIGTEMESSVFTIEDDVGKPAGISTGFGIHREDSLWDRGWDSDPPDKMNDIDSCKFL